jgi:hypothetical protein
MTKERNIKDTNRKGRSQIIAIGRYDPIHKEPKDSTMKT